jgi:Flp pilus assembly pilin Flp
MTKTLGVLKRFLIEEDAQSTTEYVLMLAAVVMIAKSMGKNIQGMVEGIITKTKQKAIEEI